MEVHPPKTILFFINWQGPWPAWMRCFLESCRWNPTVNWLILSETPAPDDLPPNVRIKPISFEDYRELIEKRLSIKVKWRDSYKLCDIKPAFGFLHPEELHGFDYWGYCDLDVIFGDIRKILNAKALSSDLITTHTHIVAGHFTLLRNTPELTSAFKKIPFWRRLLSSAAHKSFDEQWFSLLFLKDRGRRKWVRMLTPYLGGGYFEDQHSTSIPPLKWIDGTEQFPTEWYWDKGRLTTNRSGDREFLYLHFSHWQSDRWTPEVRAPWKTLERLVRLDSERPDSFTISARGFTPLPPHLAHVAAGDRMARRG